MQITETVLNFKILNHTGSAKYFIDISESMSALNRKLFRQTGVWPVLAANAYATDGAAYPAPVPFTIAINGAPRTWVTRNSILKAHSAWMLQQRDARTEGASESVKPRWEDFKIYLNEDHRVTGSLLPTSGHPFTSGTDNVSPGEWAHSLYVIVEDEPTRYAVDEKFMHILGDDNSNSYGLIKNYQNSRAHPDENDPDVPTLTDNTMYAHGGSAFGPKTQEILQNMENANDAPPYDADAYVGGDTNAIYPYNFAYGACTGSLGRKVQLNGFSAPNGLLMVQVDASTENSDFWLQLVIGERSDY